MSRLIFPVLVCVVASVHQATASVIYDNGGPDLTGHLTGGAFVSDFDVAPELGFAVQVGDDFTLSQPSVIRDVHWWGAYGIDTFTPPLLDDFTIRLFNVVAGVPAVNPFHEINVGHVGRTDTGDDILLLVGQPFPEPPLFVPSDLFEFWVDVPDIPLAADTYFLSIVNDTTDHTDSWRWAFVADGGNFKIRFNDGDAWLSQLNDQGMAFNLTGDAVVPEPSTLALAAFGLIALFAYGRRRRA